MENKKEVTFHRFYSEIRYFLSRLKNKPTEAEISKYLKDNGVKQKKLINDLISNFIIKRHETIKDRTNSDEETAKYVVKYYILGGANFEDKIYKLWQSYFGKVNESVFADEEKLKKQILNSPDGDVYRKRGGIKESDTHNSGEYAFDAVIGSEKKKKGESDVVRRSIHIYKPKLKENMRKRIFITESQFDYIQHIINENNAGDLLNEEGEGGAGAENINIQGVNGDTVRTRGVGPFADKGNGFFDGCKSSSAPVKMRGEGSKI